MPNLPTPASGDVWGATLNSAIESLHRTGVHSARPTGGLVSGTLYACTTHAAIERWNGTVWEDWLVQPSSGGGSTGIPMPVFDIPPTIPNPRDDEFNGVVFLDSKWARGPVAFNDRLIDGRLEITAGGEGKSYVLSQGIPVTGKPMSIIGKLGGWSDDGDLRVGIFLGNTVTPKALLVGMTCAPNDTRWGMAIEVTSNFSITSDWGAFSGEWSGDKGGFWSGSPVWYRLTWTGQLLEAYISPNGTNWRWIYSRPQDTAPNMMGIALYANSGFVPQRGLAHFEWVRMNDSGTPDVNQPITREWTKDGFTGLLDALGRDGRGSYENPVYLNRVSTSMSSQLSPSNGSEKALSQIPTDAITHTAAPAPGQWWKIDLGPKRIKVSHYGLRGGSVSHLPRNFQLEGSNDDSNWTVLHIATGSNGPSGPMGWWSAPIAESIGVPYRYLRITQTGSNSSGGDYFLSAGIEFWGTLTTGY